MQEPLAEWNPFDFLIERDSSVGSNPDLVFLSRQPLVPTVGVCLVEDYEGAITHVANAAIERLTASRPMARVAVDTRLDKNAVGLRNPAEVESLIARMDVLITTRLHGTVLALKNGVPVIAIDPEGGGNKIRRQAELIGWPVIFNADALNEKALEDAFDYCLTEAAKIKARQCAEDTKSRVMEIRDEFIRALKHPGELDKRYQARQATPPASEWMRRFIAARPVKVSVLVMTYNHSRFIRQALDSVLMQQTKFDFEILISEDCSTDGTREIVAEYQRRCPDKVRLLLSEKNLHSNAIVGRGIEAAQGEYIALLDGDDYWVSPHKMQKQADFLDKHPEFAICFHNARVLNEADLKRERNWTPADHPEVSTLEDLWLGNFIPTCSTMFRRGLIKEVPEWYNTFTPMITDWPLHILNAEHGHIGYINEVMGVYRHHDGGLYSQLAQREKLIWTLKFYRRMNECLEYRYDDMVKTAISKYFIEWVEEYLSRGDLEAARTCFKSYLGGRPINKYVSARRMLSNALRLYLPRRMLPKRLR
jgi:glycosyltransferase involved in cell wall biosynthesis